MVPSCGALYKSEGNIDEFFSNFCNNCCGKKEKSHKGYVNLELSQKFDEEKFKQLIAPEGVTIEKSSGKIKLSCKYAAQWAVRAKLCITLLRLILKAAPNEFEKNPVQLITESSTPKLVISEKIAIKICIKVASVLGCAGVSSLDYAKLNDISQKDGIDNGVLLCFSNDGKVQAGHLEKAIIKQVLKIGGQKQALVKYLIERKEDVDETTHSQHKLKLLNGTDLLLHDYLQKHDLDFPHIKTKTCSIL